MSVSVFFHHLCLPDITPTPTHRHRHRHRHTDTGTGPDTDTGTGTQTQTHTDTDKDTAHLGRNSKVGGDAKDQERGPLQLV